MLDDETLRDGLQSPSVRHPSIDEKIGILHHMAALGIDTADIGLPGAGPKVAKDVERLARAIGEARLKISANCAARTMIGDIKPIAEIQQRTGVAIECCAFIGSSPIRQYAEGWSIEFLQKCTDDALTFAAKEGLTTMYVTEDTTRADPNSLKVLYTTAIRTATGVHAAAVVKAFHKGDRGLMDAVYAAVPASMVGREQEIEVGPMSGRSNVVFWLEKRGLPATDEIVDRVFAAAKASNRTLTHDQIQTIIDDTKLRAIS